MEGDGRQPVRLDAAYCRRLLPRRDPSAHKFTFGRVVLVCGSLDYAGAAYLAALAAARGGAGLVAMAVPVALRPALAARLPEAILIGLPETRAGTVDAARAVEAINAREPDALVVGPGLSETDEYRDLVLALLTELGPPAVVDAGALNMLSLTDEWWELGGRNLILTPHAGEFARLTGSPVGTSDEERVERAFAATQKFDEYVVLKGPRTVVADPGGPVAVSPFANAALATAGSGDVLAGLIGALLAQDLDPFDAACLGVYLHARAGQRISERLGDSGLIATDLPLEIALARRELADARGA